MKVKNGYVVATQTFDIKKQLDEADADILALIILEMHELYGSEAKELISNITPDLDMKINVVVPQIGDKKKLLDMSMKNVMFFRREKAERPRRGKLGGHLEERPGAHQAQSRPAT